MNRHGMMGGLVGAVLSVSLSAVPAAASTQEFLAVVESGSRASAKVKTVTVFYVSHKVSPGTNEMFDPAASCVFMINDAFVTQEAFLRAVTPGKRLYCRGNRHHGQFYGLYTTPFFAADGIISKVDGRSIEVRHRQGYIMVTPAVVTQKAEVTDGMLVRYEGRDATAAEALKPARHVRVLRPRKQIVQVVTADAHVRGTAEVKATYPLRKKDGHVQAMEGFFLEMRGGAYALAAFDADGLTESEQPLVKADEPNLLVDGQYVPIRAALRPGARILTCPDQIISPRKAYRVFVAQQDDGTVEGLVKRREDGKLIIETTVCPTGKAADAARRDVTVKLDRDAEYHLNGVVGFSARKTLDEKAEFTRLRFTVLKGSGSLGRGVAEIRFLQGEREIQPAKIEGYKNAAILVDGKTDDIVKWGHGSSATLTFDKPVAPTGFRLWTDGTGRGVQSFQVEGAKAGVGDGVSWVELLHHDVGKGNELPQRRWVQMKIDLSKVDAQPLTIDKALVPGSFVRVLPALPKGAVLVRDAADE